MLSAAVELNKAFQLQYASPSNYGELALSFENYCFKKAHEGHEG